jgi:hypothetical protein
MRAVTTVMDDPSGILASWGQQHHGVRESAASSNLSRPSIVQGPLPMQTSHPLYRTAGASEKNVQHSSMQPPAPFAPMLSRVE